MATREVSLELLLGRRVRDAAGGAVGRIEEVRAEGQDGAMVIREYLLGPAGLMERLSAWSVGTAILRLLGASKLAGGYRVPWEQMDLTDPEHPRLRCARHELRTLGQDEKGGGE